jgi:uracil-DNA glycosylase
MVGPVVTPRPIASKVYLVGQAPGPREGALGRPFAWTAGKQLFRWFESIGVDEEGFRSRAYVAAVCRCFPGKASGGGDRVPSGDEVLRCSRWMQRELDLLEPELVIPVGKLAIGRFLEAGSLDAVIGKKHRRAAFGHELDVIPLPHPSGASTWWKLEPGKTLTQRALRLLSRHPAWKGIQSREGAAGRERATSSEAQPSGGAPSGSARRGAKRSGAPSEERRPAATERKR